MSDTTHDDLKKVMKEKDELKNEVMQLRRDLDALREKQHAQLMQLQEKHEADMARVMELLTHISNLRAQYVALPSFVSTSASLQLNTNAAAVPALPSGPVTCCCLSRITFVVALPHFPF